MKRSLLKWTVWNWISFECLESFFCVVIWAHPLFLFRRYLELEPASVLIFLCRCKTNCQVDSSRLRQVAVTTAACRHESLLSSSLKHSPVERVRGHRRSPVIWLLRLRLVVAAMCRGCDPVINLLSVIGARWWNSSNGLGIANIVSYSQRQYRWGTGPVNENLIGP